MTCQGGLGSGAGPCERMARWPCCTRRSTPSLPLSTACSKGVGRESARIRGWDTVEAPLLPRCVISHQSGMKRALRILICHTSGETGGTLR
jgi:hypothetical protein